MALVAQNNLTNFKSRQVFYLESISEWRDYLIISPTSYNSGRPKDSNQRRGETSMREEDLFSHFEHVIVGFHKEGYTPVSEQVECDSHEEVLFELEVRQEEEVSIRFNQFFKGYLKEEERLNHQYSSVILELYKVNEKDDIKGEYSLVDHCQGCNRALSGARSARTSTSLRVFQ